MNTDRLEKATFIEISRNVIVLRSCTLINIVSHLIVNQSSVCNCTFNDHGRHVGWVEQGKCALMVTVNCRH